MDPASIAVLSSAALHFLVPYLKTAGEGAAKEVGSAAAGTVFATGKQMYELIRDKFSKTPADAALIGTLSKSPDDASAQSDARAGLERGLQSDEHFAKQIAELLTALAATKSNVNFVNQIQGDVAKIANFGTVYGNVSF